MNKKQGKLVVRNHSTPAVENVHVWLCPNICFYD